MLKRWLKLEKKYILWVTTKDENGGYASRWYGWSTNLKFSYKEAKKKKAKLQDQFYDIDIVEL